MPTTFNFGRNGMKRARRAAWKQARAAQVRAWAPAAAPKRKRPIDLAIAPPGAVK